MEHSEVETTASAKWSSHMSTSDASQLEKIVREVVKLGSIDWWTIMPIWVCGSKERTTLQLAEVIFLYRILGYVAFICFHKMCFTSYIYYIYTYKDDEEFGLQNTLWKLAYLVDQV